MTRTTRIRTFAGTFICLVLLLADSGCSPEPTSSGRPPQPNDPAIFKIKGKTIEAEVVFDDLSRKLGLMNREKMEWNKGMMFIFPAPKQLSFWMKNTVLPLSIAFIDDEGVIRQIRDMKPKDLSSVGSKDVLRYALEMNKGWFEKEGVGVGDRFEGFRETISRFPVR